MWSECIIDNENIERRLKTHTIGIIEGEGIGHDVINAAVLILSSIEKATGVCFNFEYFRADIQKTAFNKYNRLLKGFIEFGEKIFSMDGAILSGPLSGRFVYDLRKQFDLFCKLVPIRSFPEINKSNRIKKKYLNNSDILIVRENISGVYFGKSKSIADTQNESRKIEYTFSCDEKNIIRIIKVATKLARKRQGKLTVVVKDGGIIALSNLWREAANKIDGIADINVTFANVDFISYDIIQNSQGYDVIVAPNVFGDILADIGGIIFGSRGLTYSGNFASNGSAIYQTSHGACIDLVGQNKANPVGQIFSLAMLLRESFDMKIESDLIEKAVRQVWKDGWRTADLAAENCRIVGTRQMVELIAEAVMKISGN